MIIDQDDGSTINLRKPDPPAPPCPHCERNDARAEDARTALMAAGYLKREPDLATAIQDLVSDLRHLYDRVPIAGIHEPWSALARRADANYQAEMEGSEDEDKTCDGPVGMEEG